MAKKNRLIGVRSTDTALFLQLTDNCKCIDLVAPILTVTKPNCAPDIVTWATDPCTGKKLYRVARAPQQRVVLSAAIQNGACGGFVMFHLTPAFHALGAGRLEAELSSVSTVMQIQLQVFAQNPGIQTVFATLPQSPQLPLPPVGINAPGAFYNALFIVIAQGDQEIPLFRIRAPNGLFQVFINGVLYSTPSDYQVIGSTLVLPESIGAQVGDNILVVFQ